MNPGFLVGAGFLLGSVGLKAATSKKAKKIYVKGIVQGMRAKEEIETMVDEARAEFDDLLAEAGYVKDSENEEDVSALIESAEDIESEQESSFSKSKSTSNTRSISTDEALKQATKVVNTAAKAVAGKGAGKGAHGHGHGRGGK